MEVKPKILKKNDLVFCNIPFLNTPKELLNKISTKFEKWIPKTVEVKHKLVERKMLFGTSREHHLNKINHFHLCNIDQAFKLISLFKMSATPTM